LEHIVTGDEALVSHYAPENKPQSQEQHHAHSPTKETMKSQADTFSGKALF
jgi:hypothetical protein